MKSSWAAFLLLIILLIPAQSASAGVKSESFKPPKIVTKLGVPPSDPARMDPARMSRRAWLNYFSRRLLETRESGARSFASRMDGRNPIDETTVAGKLGITSEVLALAMRKKSVDLHGMLDLAPFDLARVFHRAYHDKNPDSPGEYAAFRSLQERSQDGMIRPDGLANAGRQMEQLQANVRAGMATPFPGQRAGWEGPEVAGIDSTRWTAMGPGNIGGRTRAIIVFPDSNFILFGSVSGGIWRTTNGGQTWNVVNDFLANLAISCFAQSPLDRSIIYAGTGEGYGIADRIRGDGIFKSTDNGVTWSQLSSTANNTNFRIVTRITIDPNNMNVLLAATSTGIFKSTDAGASWVQTLTISGGMLDVDFHPTSSNHAVASGSGKFTRYSTSGGDSWTSATGITSAGRVEVAFAPSNGSIVYASQESNVASVRAFYRSTDTGATYQFRSKETDAYLTEQDWYNNCIWVDPTNPDTICVAGVDIGRSGDGGLDFNKITRWNSYYQYAGRLSPHADHHILISHPNFNGTSNREFYTGNDGGICKTNDIYRADTNLGWTNMNNHLGVTQGFGAAGNSAGTFWFGSQDNGTSAYFGDSNAWTDHVTRGGDGGFCAADPLDPNYFYGEFQYGLIYRSTNGGISAGDSTGAYTAGLIDPFNGWIGGVGDGFFVSPFVLDPHNNNRIYLGAQQLYRTSNVKDATPTWTTMNLNNQKISCIAVSPRDSNIVWVGMSSDNINNATISDVYYTTNALATTEGDIVWTKVDANGVGLPERYCARIAIDPRNNNRVFVTFGGYNADNLWMTSDSGMTWNKFDTASPALPAAPIRSILFGNYSSDSLYVGSEVGIFASANGGAAWSPTTDGPANVAVDELLWVGADTLYAATHGRGLWRISVPRPDTFVPDTSVPNPWYVNDNSTTGDSFTSSVGSDANHGLTRLSPKLTISSILPFLSAGDSIYIDAGTFAETVVLNANNISLIGKDSLSTIIDPPGARSVNGLFGIYADTQTGLLIKNLAVTGAYDGINFYNVDASTIQGDSLGSCGNYGIHLRAGSDFNLVSACTASNNLFSGIYMGASSGCTITGNIFNAQSFYGLTLNASSNNSLSQNTVSWNGFDGFVLEAGSSNNTVSWNTARSNSSYGISLSSSSSNSFIGNVIGGNLSSGLYLNNSSSNQGFLNTFDSNLQYQISLNGSSDLDTFQRNNFVTSPTNPDSILFNGTSNPFLLTRNSWGSVDSAVIKAKIGGPGRNLVSYIPYRLRSVDTTPGADSIAPASPTGLGVDVSTYARIRLTWSAVTANEDGHFGGASVANYYVYRSRRSDTTVWGLPICETVSLIFTDTLVLGDTDYYYRITAQDNATQSNQSFYSDTISGRAMRGVADFSGDSAVTTTDVQMIVPLYKQPAAYNVLFDIGKNGVDGIINEEDYLEMGKRFGL